MAIPSIGLRDVETVYFNSTVYHGVATQWHGVWGVGRGVPILVLASHPCYVIVAPECRLIKCCINIQYRQLLLHFLFICQSQSQL